MSVTISLTGLERMLSPGEVKRRQTEYAMRAGFVMRKFVPLEENTLRASEPMNSKYDKGLLIWSTPYAAKQYNVPMNHTTAGTTDHWDEACWSAEGGNLTKYAESLYGGY